MDNSNLPPGVSEWMIPGNRPEDVAWENALEKAMHRVKDICCDNYKDCQFSEFDENDEWEGCMLNITTTSGYLGNGDIGDCPYVEAKAEEYLDEGMGR